MQALQFTVAYIGAEAQYDTSHSESLINQALLLIAAACKRGWLDPNTLQDSESSLQLKQALHSTVLTWMGDPSPRPRILAMKLISILVEEFSGVSKSSARINMPWEFHIEVFNTFEKTALLQFYQMAFATLQAVMQRVELVLVDPVIKKLFRDTLSVLSLCLQWPFGNGSHSILGFGFSKRSLSDVLFSPEWRSAVFESSDALELFFQVFKLLKSEGGGTSVVIHSCFFLQPCITGLLLFLSWQ